MVSSYPSRYLAAVLLGCILQVVDAEGLLGRALSVHSSPDLYLLKFLFVPADFIVLWLSA